MPDLDANDKHEQFISAMEQKYGANDAANMDRDDGIEAGTDAGTMTTTSSTDDEGDAKHTAPGTSAAPDGAATESGEEIAGDDDDEHPDGADPASTDSPAAAASTEGGEAAEQEEDPETAIAEDTKALLATKGADLKIEDVPEQYRPLIEKKIRSIDQAFSRQSAENTAWRADRAQYEAEQQFQAEHPELLIAELLRKHPELEAKVFEASPDPDDAASVSAFDQKVAATRKAAKDAVDANEVAMVEAHQRADEAVATAHRLSAAAGLDFELVQPALILAFQAKPKGSQTLTEEEMAAVIAKTAKLLKKPVRAALREQSRDVVRQRTERRAATAVPARAAAAASKPATPAPTPPPKVNFDDEDSRRARMMQSVRTIMPGRK